jgi:hypothetical protein
LDALQQNKIASSSNTTISGLIYQANVTIEGLGANYN